MLRSNCRPEVPWATCTHQLDYSPLQILHGLYQQIMTPPPQEGLTASAPSETALACPLGQQGELAYPSTHLPIYPSTHLPISFTPLYSPKNHKKMSNLKNLAHTYYVAVGVVGVIVEIAVGQKDTVVSAAGGLRGRPVGIIGRPFPCCIHLIIWIRVIQGQ